MRIVGGSLSGRRFSAPTGKTTRPTTERVREAVASALESRDRIRDAVVLDLYAGTGALSFEALSRGATRATLVDRDRRAVLSIEASARELGLSDRITTIVADLRRPGATWHRRIARPVTLVFADPPYAEADAVAARLQELSMAGILAPRATVVVEHDPKREPQMPTDFERIAAYRYGDSAILMCLAPAAKEPE